MIRKKINRLRKTYYNSSINDDYGFIIMNIGKWDLKINLWTATGQDFYCMTRSTVLQGTDGIIFIADSNKDLINENLKSFNELKGFFPNKLGKNIPIVACLNKRDIIEAISITSFKKEMNFPTNTNVFETIAFKKGKNIQASFKFMFDKILEIHSEIYQTIKNEINFKN